MCFKLQAARIEALHQQLRARRSRLKKQISVQMRPRLLPLVWTVWHHNTLSWAPDTGSSPRCCRARTLCQAAEWAIVTLGMTRGRSHFFQARFIRHLFWLHRKKSCWNKSSFFLKRIHIMSTKCYFCQWVQKNWTFWVVFVPKLWCEEIPTLIWRRE